MFSAALKFSILALALPLSVLAASHGHLLNRRHAELAKRSEANVTLDRRVSGARFSYYDTQTGNAYVSNGLLYYALFCELTLGSIADLVAHSSATLALLVFFSVNQGCC